MQSVGRCLCSRRIRRQPCLSRDEERRCAGVMRSENETNGRFSWCRLMRKKRRLHSIAKAYCTEALACAQTLHLDTKCSIWPVRRVNCVNINRRNRRLMACYSIIDFWSHDESRVLHLRISKSFFLDFACASSVRIIIHQYGTVKDLLLYLYNVTKETNYVLVLGTLDLFTLRYIWTRQKPHFHICTISFQ